MAIEIVTKEDLHAFRMQLLNDIRQLLIPQEAKLIKPWLKNAEVKRLKWAEFTITGMRILKNY